MNDFSRDRLLADLASDLRYAANGGKIQDRGDIASLLDNSGAPSVDYAADAWEIVAGSEYDDIDPENLDFSDCKTALECLTREAEEKIRLAYEQERETMIDGIAGVIDEFECMGPDDQILDHVRVLSDYPLGDIPHIDEIDLPHTAAESVKIWRLGENIRMATRIYGIVLEPVYFNPDD